jgi:hypothetical protein
MKNTNPKPTENQKSENTKKDQKKVPTLSASFPGLVDMVDKDGEVAFLFKEKGNLRVEKSYVDEKGNRLIPPEKNEIPFDLVPANKVLDNYEDDNDCILYKDIIKKLEEVARLPLHPQMNYYHLVTVFILSTYLQEGVSYFPMLWFFGPPERGKSRMVKAISNLSFRGLYTETLNQAYLFRFAELFHGTLLIDVYDLISPAQGKGSYDLLLGRYEKGMRIPRVLSMDKGPFKDISYFEIAGPTVLATNVEIAVTDPLRGRCILLMMPEARGVWPNNNSNEDLGDLKARLVAFRARHLGTGLPEFEKRTSGRLGDITHPLLRVANLFPDVALTPLLSLIELLEMERKDLQSETLTGRIAQALYDLQKDVEKGKLRVKKVIDTVNKQGMAQSSDKMIGRELALMGVNKVKSGGVMQIIWEPKTMEKIWDRHGVLENHP